MYKNMDKQIDRTTFQKMQFIMNAIDTGWSVKKSDDNYIFTKKHEGKREVFMADYLEKFITENMKLEGKTLGSAN
jgi:hypothetical protein